MTQYIDKSAIKAEIERMLRNVNLNYVNTGLHPSALDTNKKLQEGISKNLQSILSFLDTLEMKEVGLNEEIESYFKGFGKFPSVGIDDCIDIAKHFYELGLKQNDIH